MRRVVILGPMPTRDTVGGVAVHTDRLAASLALTGREVTVLSDSHVESWHPDEVRGALAPAIVGVRGGSPGRLLARAARRPGPGLAAATRALGADERRRLHIPPATAISRSLIVGMAVDGCRAEVLHIQQADFRPLFADWAGVRLPRLITVHGLGALQTGEYPALREIVPANLNRAAAIATPSRALADEVASLGIPLERVRVVPNAVDHGTFHPRDRSACRTELGLDPDAPLAVYVGRLTRHKGVTDLLAAWTLVRGEVPGATLALVGPTADDISTDVPGVLAPGPVAQDRAAVWLGAADVVAVPSRYEGFGLAALEAMASARAVVATRVGGLPEVVAEGAGIIVPVGDADALAEALARSLGDPRLAEAAGAVGARAAAAYTWERAAEAYGSLYDAL